MSRNKIKKVEVNKEIFLYVLKQKNCSIRKLGDKGYKKVQRTEKQIRRYLNAGEMPVDVLYNIGKYLNVDPKFISGRIHSEINQISDEHVKRTLYNQLSLEKHPYPYESYSIKDYPIFFNTLLNINNISEEDFKKLSFEDRVFFHQDISLAILNVIIKYFEYNSKGEDIFPQLQYAESVVNSKEVDPFSYFAQLEGINLSKITLSEL